MYCRWISERTRVKAGNDERDIGGLEGKYAQNSFDPYWFQSEFEAVQSKAVLSKVIEKLKEISPKVQGWWNVPAKKSEPAAKLPAAEPSKEAVPAGAAQ